MNLTTLKIKSSMKTIFNFDLFLQLCFGCMDLVDKTYLTRLHVHRLQEAVWAGIVQDNVGAADHELRSVLRYTQYPPMSHVSGLKLVKTQWGACVRRAQHQVPSCVHKVDCRSIVQLQQSVWPIHSYFSDLRKSWFTIYTQHAWLGSVSVKTMLVFVQINCILYA